MHPQLLVCLAVLGSTATCFAPLIAAEEVTVVEMPFGEMRMLPSAVELQVTARPNGDAIEIPRLNNRIGSVYLKSDEKQQPLAFKPGVKTWSIALPAKSQDELTIVVETKEAPHLPTMPTIVTADDNGDVILPAYQSVTHGKMLRYEPQPHKNTVGYWVNVEDWCEWKFKTEKPARYSVHILQGCGKGHGGSEVDIVVGDQSLSFTVEDTGHFQNFKSRKIGELNLAAGQHELAIRPQKKAKAAVMDVREVRLERVE